MPKNNRSATSPPKAKQRFPFQAVIRYQHVNRAGRPNRRGVVVAMSSEHLWMQAEEAPLLHGEAIEAEIEWPILLPGGIRRRLQITGRVADSFGTDGVLSIEKYEFRSVRIEPR